MHADDLSMFRGLELEEPSLEVDGTVLAEARRRPYVTAGRRGPPGPLGLFGLLGAAAVLGIVVTGFSGWLENDGPMPAHVSQDFVGPAAGAQPDTGPSETGTPSSGTLESASQLRVATGELRRELEAMRSRTGGIPSENDHLREEIEARIRLCLADLVSVERSLAAFAD
jgi:hypothetical protein